MTDHDLDTLARSAGLSAMQGIVARMIRNERGDEAALAYVARHREAAVTPDRLRLSQTTVRVEITT